MMKRVAFLRAALLFFFAVIQGSTLANAARPARVEVEDGILLDSPSKKARAVRPLLKGEPLAVSNEIIEGFYKVRDEQGEIGFVASDSLAVFDNPAASATPAPRSVPFFRIRGLADAHFQFPAGILSSIGVTTLRPIPTFGGEIHFLLPNGVGLLVRTDWVARSFSVQDGTTGVNYLLKLQGLPIQGGVLFPLASNKTIGLHVVVMGGFDPMISATWNVLNDTSTPLTFKGQSVVATGKIETQINLAKNFHFFGELGYRYHRSMVLAGNTSGSGASFFTADGVFSNQRVDLSGIFAGGGLGLQF